MSWSRETNRGSVTYILQVLGLLGIKWLRHLDCVLLDLTLEKNCSESRKYRGNIVKVGSACCAPRIFFFGGRRGVLPPEIRVRPRYVTGVHGHIRVITL